jgi:SAM-dependent methyltransferase
MSKEGPEFFDDPDVFQQYLQHRESRDNPNDTMENPVILDLLGPVSGARILDLGCGDGRLGRNVLDRGAASYFGVDGSPKMVALAKENLLGSAAQVVREDIRAWTYPLEAFEVVLSRLALHYIEDLDGVLREIRGCLIPGGRFIFSVEHPVLTSCDKALPPGTIRQDWIVDNYFNTGHRATRWMGELVVKYHRTVEDYFVSLQKAGFVIEQLREGKPDRHAFSANESFERRTRIPLFLIFELGNRSELA